MNNKTKKYILTGLMTALVFILTFIIKIPVPYTSGYIHLGDSMIYVSVIVLGPVFGAFASGVGSMLADILGGYAQYALPTLIIKSIMALIMGLILSGKTLKASIASVMAAISLWVAFCASTLLYLQSRIKSMGHSNLVQMIAGNNADAQALESTTSALKNLPVYLTVGIALLIMILAVSAYLVSRREGKGVFTVKAVIGMSAAGMCMVMGYFLVESFMYTPIAAIFSIPANMIQFFGGVLAAGLFAPVIIRASNLSGT